MVDGTGPNRFCCVVGDCDVTKSDGNRCRSGWATVNTASLNSRSASCRPDRRAATWLACSALAPAPASCTSLCLLSPGNHRPSIVLG